MIRIISLLLGLLAVLVVAKAAWNLGFLETFVAVFLIIAFAIFAAGWTNRHDA